MRPSRALNLNCADPEAGCADAYGQVMVSEEKDGAALGPRHLYYYFNGNRIGDVGNDGVAATAAERRMPNEGFDEQASAATM